MSCDMCKGREDINYNKSKQDAETFTKETGKSAVIYLEGQDFKFMEAQAFFDNPQGRVINCISPVQ